MYDVAEIRNIGGEKINVHLSSNKTSNDELGDWCAQVRIGGEAYMLVAKPANKDERPDSEGRVWSLVGSKPRSLPDEFFGQDNVSMIIQIIAPFIMYEENKLRKIAKVLKGEE